MSVRSAMSVKTCWSRPIAVSDGKERQALRISSARKPRLPAHARASATCFSRKARRLLIFFDETDGVFASPLTFPLVSVQFRHTLRVCREVSLTVSDDQRELGGVLLLSHTTCGLDLPLLPMLGTAICALHVSYIQAPFGAHAQTIASLVPIAFGIEH